MSNFRFSSSSPDLHKLDLYKNNANFNSPPIERSQSLTDLSKIHNDDNDDVDQNSFGLQKDNPFADSNSSVSSLTTVYNLYPNPRIEAFKQQQTLNTCHNADKQTFGNEIKEQIDKRKVLITYLDSLLKKILL